MSTSTNDVGNVRMVRSHVLRACARDALQSRPAMRRWCRRNVAAHALRLHSNVQTFRRQHAAPAAPSLPRGQLCAPSARLVAGRSRERMREAKTEGQIKGAARRRPQSQSARGVGAAQHLLVPVPRQCAMPHCPGIACVPCPILCAPLRWSARDGQA